MGVALSLVMGIEAEDTDVVTEILRVQFENI